MIDETIGSPAASVPLELVTSALDAPQQRLLPLPWNLAAAADHARFAHPAEAELGRILAFYGVKWAYEPTSFVLQWDGDGRPAESFTPDFYLPAHRLYLELTTMRQPLVTRKNRKLRKLRELYPNVQIKLLYRRDLERLFGAYRQPVLVPVVEPTLSTVVAASTLDTRIAELAGDIAAARADRRGGTDRLTLLAFDQGSLRFRERLAVELARRDIAVDLLDGSLARYGRPAHRLRARFACPNAGSLRRRDVLVVADVVSTGLSTGFVGRWASRRGARSVEVCTLFDRRAARLIDLDAQYAGFAAPESRIAGFGIGADPELAALPMVVSVG